MNRCIVACGLILLLTPNLTSAAGEPAADFLSEERGLNPVGNLEVGRTFGSELTSVQADTIYLMGGPLEPDLGDFEGENGMPSMDGWFGVDHREPVEAFWQIADFNCADLDPAQPDNHAWWCGDMFPPCSGEDQPGGYGNNWHTYIEWYGTVPDPGNDVDVRLTAVLNYDVEPGYDYLYLDVGNMSGAHSFTGSNRNEINEFVPVEFEDTFTLTPYDYVGENGDQVNLRWRFYSDNSYSDEDCDWPTEGAAQIDLIAVYFDQGEGEFQVGSTETCEEGDPVQWSTGMIMSGCGSFAAAWPALMDLDPCRFNPTPQAAFIDDGLVVPGTGGYLCTTWCYGPNGYIVNPEGGLLGPSYRIWCSIWSPLLEWPEGDYDGARLEFDNYRHKPDGPTSPLILTRFYVRSTDDPHSDDPWVTHSGWQGGGPRYFRMTGDVSHLLEPGRTHVQIAFTILDRSNDPGRTDGTPAPYYDNVSFKVFAYRGPRLSISFHSDLAQDNFPEIGAIDYENLGANHVRFDAGWYDPDDQTIRDEIRLNAKAVRTGSVLAGHPKLYYKLKPNPLFDPNRNSGLPNEGFVEADSARNSNGTVIEDTWAADLPDTGFFYPGDVIHYYLQAQDDLNGDIGTAILPRDTTGFSTMPGELGYVPMLYPDLYVVRALPSLFAASPGSQPGILLWDDGRAGIHYVGYRTSGEWSLALSNLGYQEGIDYDLFVTKDGSVHGPNAGLGPRATSAQLAHYATLIYSTGEIDQYTLYEEDVALLDTWLMTGNRNLFITGNSFAFDMFENGSGNMLDFMNNWIGVDFVHSDISPFIGNQTTSLVRANPGNPVFFAVDAWLAAGSCPEPQDFDAVLAAGNTQRLAEFTDPNGQGGVYPFAAGTYYHNDNFNNTTVYLPYDFTSIWTPASGGGVDPIPSAARTHLLNEVLLHFGHLGSSPATDVPDGGVFTVRSYPNPFNPNTQIAYHMPRRGELSIRIYNLRGELVRTLLDEVVEVGDGFITWDGSDDRGQAVASGVYFYQTLALGQQHVEKLALVK